MQGIKVIIFDLDGVLVSSKDLHFRAFNDALRVCGYDPISYEDHVNLYDGLPTRKKLELYFSNQLPRPSFELATEQIYKTKQSITKDLLKEYITYNQDVFDLIYSLKKLGYKIYIATNSIRSSTKFILETLGIHSLLDGYVCNEDVQSPKPHPEMYMKVMVECSARPSETLIIEDSPIGVKAAEDSYAHIFIAKNISEVNLTNILEKIKYIEPMRNSNKKEDINVLIPMAGAGSRFKEAGYVFPKPLIEINKEPMIKVVVDSLGFNSKHIFITQEEDYKKYNLKTLLNLISEDCSIVTVNGLTEGAACTALLAKEFIDNDKELIIANSDQFLEWDNSLFLYTMRNKGVDGGILTFQSSHPKWSFAKTDKYGVVIEVAEKKPISTNATVGIYYWAKGSDFVKYAEQMVSKNIRTNGEIYLAPSYNEAIKDGKKILTFEIDKNKFWGIGDPESLNYFLENYNRQIL